MINYLTNRGLVAADAAPFILGVEKGSNFFIQSMIHSGAIDPVVGLLLLSKQTGSSQGDLFQIITQLCKYRVECGYIYIVIRETHCNNPNAVCLLF